MKNNSLIEKVINKAESFILSNMNELGLWKDFKSHNHKESIDWVSSYVGLCLLDSKNSFSNLELTANTLINRQNKGNKGWGYNEIAAPDADSTAFVIKFLLNFGFKPEIEKAKQFLLKHQGKNGGFATYLPKLIKKDYKNRISKGGDSVMGWCSETPCVTATALLALGNNKKAIEYMKKSQTKEGFWRSYWYNNDIYSTVQGIKALQSFDCKKEIKNAQKWLNKQKLPETPFYLALLLQGSIVNNNQTSRINLGINKLLDLQEKDGSWKNYNILRIPSHDNISPWNNPKIWREDITDQNRVFTTATCLQTLYQFKKNNSRTN